MMLESSIRLAPKAGTIKEKAAQWLSSRSELISQLMGCTVTNLAFACSQLAALLAAAGLILATDGVREYGWAAFCLLLAVRLSLPIIKEYKEGGER
ncbi:MAG: hypothetical protein J6B92_08110 [Paraprevotella sp.]|nr:hypothetical protein [Paraprevotella sp.]